MDMLTVPLMDPAGRIRPFSEIERSVITLTMVLHEGNISRAARALRIGRSTMYRKLKEYGL